MKRLRAFFSLVFLSTLLMAALVSPTAHAAFNQNRLIDDVIFSNTGTMTAAQIDSWLNSQFPSSCISTNNGFSSPDPTGYSPSTGYTYGGNVSGGQVIYDAAQAYGLNPQVLIATLQKESSVVSGTASYHCQYINTAMGYGCPDNGSCPTNPATMSGFSKQVIHAAWLLKFGQQRSRGNIGWNVQLNNSPQAGDHWDNSDDPPACYGGPMTQGTLSRGCGQAATFYDGYTTIDSTSVHMDTGGTAALYWYTPHFSGNQNFVSIFQGWFGSPTNVCGSDSSNRIIPPIVHTNGDYNGDHRTDISIYRSSDGCWHLRGVGDAQYGGTAGDIPVPADYNGDGETDIAIYRPGEGVWHISGVGDFAYGQSADIPVPGDYNGDGRADIAIYRPSDGSWHIRGVGDFQYGGQSGDIPVPADYNGDSRVDIAIYRPSEGVWHIRGVGDFAYGQSADIPVPGDYMGVGSAAIAVYRPSEGVWHIRGVGDFAYGAGPDIPVPGDYNGDGRADIAVYRYSDGGWHIRGVGDFAYGAPGDVPTAQTLNAYTLYHLGLIPSY